jgi:hypothetical protein
MRIKRLNEDIEWSTYVSLAAREHLEMIFTDFINPMNPDKEPATVTTEKAGMDMMAFWILTIPFKSDNLSIEKYIPMINELLEELNSCIKKTKLDMPNIINNVKVSTNKVVLTIWNK